MAEHHQSQIEATQSEAARTAGRATQLEDELKHLRKRVDSLSMTCRAMWELIRDRTTLTDEDIEQKVKEFQQSADSTAGQARNCSECGQPIVRRQTKCQYCGADVKREHLFECPRRLPRKVVRCQEAPDRLDSQAFKSLSVDTHTW